MRANVSQEQPLSKPDADDRQSRMNHFVMLSHEDQVEAIKRLARSGMSDHGIAAAAGLAVEQVRSIIGRTGQCDGCGND
jgi:hypothetical protein